jgi:hypothetical protein
MRQADSMAFPFWLDSAMAETFSFTEAQMQRLLSASERDLPRLLLEFSPEAPPQTQSFAAATGAHPADFLISGLLDQARDVIDRYSEPLRQAVCVDWRACDKLKSLQGNALYEDLVGMIGPLLARLLGGLASRLFSGLVALLLIRDGLDFFCGCASD